MASFMSRGTIAV